MAHCHRTNYLKRSIVAPDAHRFVGRIYDLSVIDLHFSSYRELSKFPDAKYVCDINRQLTALVDRIESLNNVGQMLWLNYIPVNESEFPLSFYQWLNFSTDAFLMRLSSVKDCALLLVNEVFEAGLTTRKCSLQNLKKLGIPAEIASLLSDIEEHPRLRSERNARFHHGYERGFSSDPRTFRVSSMFAQLGTPVTGKDLAGRPVDTVRYFKEGLVELQRDFNESARGISKALPPLYVQLHHEFNSRFSRKFNDPKTGYGASLDLGRRHYQYDLDL